MPAQIQHQKHQKKLWNMFRVKTKTPEQSHFCHCHLLLTLDRFNTLSCCFHCRLSISKCQECKNHFGKHCYIIGSKVIKENGIKFNYFIKKSMQSKSMYWFLYDTNFRHERVNSLYWVGKLQLRSVSRTLSNIKMELCAKMVSGFQSLTIFAKSFILDVLQSSGNNEI